MRYQSLPSSDTDKQETTKERAERQRRELRAELTYFASDEQRWAENRERVLRERRESGLVTQTMNEKLAKSTISSAAPSMAEDDSDEVDNGIFIWTETKATGHAFVSIHQNGSVTIFSYGRYDDLGITPAVGEGVLLKLEGKDASDYIIHQLYRMEAKVFKIFDANSDKVLNHFNELWINSDNYPDSMNASDVIKKFGRVIDNYDLSGNNCTTHSVNAVKESGSKVFTKDALFFDYSEDFMIPSSLEKHLNTTSNSFEMITMDMTNNMKQKFPNTKGTLPLEKAGKKEEALGVLGDSSGNIGGSTGYSGGTVGGMLGSSYGS